jgi:hypothetical protein
MWRALAADIEQWQGNALISMEWLVDITEVQIAACVDSLAPARVEVICTARDLLRNLPAQWQETTQNFNTWGWQEYADAVTDDSGHAQSPPARRFWRQHDVPRILERWISAVPSDRIHLVTVPPPGHDPEVLWQRFCSILSLDGTDFEPPRMENPSLDVVSARLMERVNQEALSRGLSREIYVPYFKHLLAKEVLAGTSASGDPIAVTSQTESALKARAESLVGELRAMKINVVGSLDDLVPKQQSQGRVPTSVDEAEVLDASVKALVSVLEKVAERYPTRRGTSSVSSPDASLDTGQAGGSSLGTGVGD